MRTTVLALLTALGLTGCAFVYDFGRYTFDQTDAGRDASSSPDASGPDVTGPRVLAHAPERILVDGRSPVTITFDEDIVARDGDVTVVLDTAVAIAGTVAVDGSILTFTPEAPLAARGTYEVSIGTGVSDLAGNPLAEPAVFSFIAPDAGNDGSPPRRLDIAGEGDVSCPHLAMDVNGNAWVLFQRGDSLYTARYRAGAGWEDTQLLATGDDGTLAVSPAGRVAVAYTATVAGVPRILVRVTPELGGSTFGAAEVADEGAVHPIDLTVACNLDDQGKSLAINDEGTAVVVWKYYEATDGDPMVGVYHALRAPDGAWAAPARIPLSYLSEPVLPAVAIDAAGRAELVVAESGGDAMGVYRTRRREPPGVTWSAPVTRETYVAKVAPRVAVDHDGVFTWALSTSDPSGAPQRLTARAGAWSASPNEIVIPTSSIPRQVYLSVQERSWVVWHDGSGGLGVTGLSAGVGSPWIYDSRLLSEADATSPIIAGTGDAGNDVAEAIVVWERAGAIRWAAVGERDSITIPVVVVAPRALPLASDTQAHSPRLVYDAPGRHGLVVYAQQIGDASALYAHTFHRLPSE